MLCWSSSSCGGASPKRSRLARFDRRRSCSSYVARMPWRSIAFATRSARCVNTRFMRVESFVRCLCMVLSGGRAGSRLPYRRRPVTSVFYLFRDAPQRRAALAARAGLGRRATRSTGWISSPSAGTPCATTSSDRASRGVGAAGGRGAEARPRGAPEGTAATSRPCSRRSARSTAPTSCSRRSTPSGIPLMLLARARACAPPFVYVAIGLPERLAQLRSRRMERLYARALGAASAIVAYSEHEAEVLARLARRARGDVPRRVRAVRRRRRGVPADERAARRSTSSRSAPTRIATSSCCSTVARAMPDTSFRVVTTADRARSLDGRPANVSVETDLPFDEMRRRLERGARRRAPRARQQLLGRDDGAAPGDGAREAGRRHADGGDRDGLRARGRRERAARRAGGRGGLRPSARPRCSATSAGARARRAGTATVERAAHVGAVRRARSRRSSRRAARLSARSPDRSAIVRRVSARSVGAGSRSRCSHSASARCSSAGGDLCVASDQGVFLSVAARMLDGDRLYAEVDREQGSALLLHVRRRPLDRRLARAVPARRALVRSRGRRDLRCSSRARVRRGPPSSRASSSTRSRYGRLVPRRHVDARRARRCPARAVALAPRAIRRCGRCSPSSSAPQAQSRAARGCPIARAAPGVGGAACALVGARSTPVLVAWARALAAAAASSALRGELRPYLELVAYNVYYSSARTAVRRDASVALREHLDVVVEYFDPRVAGSYPLALLVLAVVRRRRRLRRAARGTRTRSVCSRAVAAATTRRLHCCVVALDRVLVRAPPGARVPGDPHRGDADLARRRDRRPRAGAIAAAACRAVRCSGSSLKSDDGTGCLALLDARRRSAPGAMRSSAPVTRRSQTSTRRDVHGVRRRTARTATPRSSATRFDLVCRYFHLYPFSPDEQFDETLDCADRERPDVRPGDARLLRSTWRYARGGTRSSRPSRRLLDASYELVETSIRASRSGSADRHAQSTRSTRRCFASSAVESRASRRDGSRARRTRPSSTGCGHARHAPTWRSSTSSRRRPRAAGTSSCAPSCASSSGRGLDGRAEPHLRRDAGLPLQLVQLRLPRGCGGSPAAARGWCTASTARSASTAASTTAPTRGSPRSTPSSRPRRSSSRGSRSRSTASSGSSSATRSSIPNAVDPAIFHPPVESGAARRDGRSGWSRRAGRTTRARAATTLAWLDRNLDHARYELTFAGRAPRAFEHVRVVGPLDSNALADAPAHAGRLPRAEPRRSVLERAARGARLRAAGGVSRERRPPGARRRGRPSVPGGRRSSATSSSGSSPSSTSGVRRSRRRSISWVADRYLEVLGLRVAA